MTRHTRFFTLMVLGLAVFAMPTLFASQAGKPQGQAGEPQGQTGKPQGQVNVYSYRQPFLVEPLFDAFRRETGIEVKVIFAKKGLIERMKAEGTNSPADVLLTTDIARLSEAAQSIAQPVASEILRNTVPASARSGDNLWFGLTWRARIAYASRARVPEETLSYLELADEKWRGRVCLRSGQHPYNNALFAAMLAHLGEADFAQWLTGLKANLNAKPSGNDRAQVRQVFGGVCDVAIGNTYYMGQMQTNEDDPQQKQWAASVKPIFATMPNGGAHVNVSGMVMAKHAPNRQNAVQLMEFLVSPRAQKIYAEVNYEYPIRRDVAASERVSSWGVLTQDALSMEAIASRRKRASEMVDETAFNEGP
jgi:iron(III) transport system substrate-binding protein